MQYDFGVALGVEVHTASLEFCAQLPVVVDLAVVHEHLTARGGLHRLQTGIRKVEDREAHAPESHLAAADRAAPAAPSVGAAVALHLQHVLEGPIEQSRGTDRDHPRYAAHLVSSCTTSTPRGRI